MWEYQNVRIRMKRLIDLFVINHFIGYSSLIAEKVYSLLIVLIGLFVINPGKR